MSSLNNFHLPPLVPFFSGEPGQEHYRLLGYLASQYKNQDIFDIGTYLGYSALALSCGESSNTILSFDIVKKDSLPVAKNIQYVMDNLMEDSGKAIWSERLLKSPLIFLDIDPHIGELEYDFYLWLKSKNYQGIMLCDDIHYFENMKNNFWNKVAAEDKLDVTKFGHWSGTGLIYFNKDKVPEFFKN